MTANMIELDGVSKTFNAGQPNEFHAVRESASASNRAGSPRCAARAVPARPRCSA
jgi:hypothetical protein